MQGIEIAIIFVWICLTLAFRTISLCRSCLPDFSVFIAAHVHHGRFWPSWWHQCLAPPPKCESRAEGGREGCMLPYQESDWYLTSWNSSLSALSPARNVVFRLWDVRAWGWRLGWDVIRFIELENMFDARYSLHTCSMLRNCHCAVHVNQKEKHRKHQIVYIDSKLFILIGVAAEKAAQIRSQNDWTKSSVLTLFFAISRGRSRWKNHRV